MITMLQLWTALLVALHQVPEIHSASSLCNTSCSLPDCHCDPLAIPRNIRPADTPQIVAFTFSGTINADARNLLREVFSTQVKNPNGCPVSITIFVLGKNTKFCEVHRLYVRGHEIAVQGYNSTYPEQWTTSQWRGNVADLKAFMEREKFVPSDSIKGMRAPLQQPGGDEQFTMLDQSDFTWDSTLLGGPVNLQDPSHWPTTLTYGIEDKDCLNPGFCPKKTYPDLWKVPLLRLSNDIFPCTYLDACVTNADMKLTDEVFDLLFENFERNYVTNRAPFQVNIRSQSLTDPIQRDALKQFLNRLLSYEDTWMVSISDTLAWMQSPVDKDEAKQYLVWECPDRDYNSECSESGNTNITKDNGPNANLGDFISPQTLIIVEYVLLFVSYIVIVAYDRNAHKND